MRLLTYIDHIEVSACVRMSPFFSASFIVAHCWYGVAISNRREFSVCRRATAVPASQTSCAFTRNICFPLSHQSAQQICVQRPTKTRTTLYSCGCWLYGIIIVHVPTASAAEETKCWRVRKVQMARLPLQLHSHTLSPVFISNNYLRMHR